MGDMDFGVGSWIFATAWQIFTAPFSLPLPSNSSLPVPGLPRSPIQPSPI